MSSPDVGGVPARTRLPAASMSALADLVAAGYGMAVALNALPRKSLPSKTVKQLDSEVAALQAGGPLDVALQRLGLEITAASIRGSQTNAVELEDALRADAAAGKAQTEGLRKTRSRVQFFSILVAGFALATLFISMILVPSMLQKVASDMPEDWELPRALIHFEGLRNLWLALAGGFLLFCVALVFAYAGLLGRRNWLPFLHDLRLHLPFLRGHAIHSTSARLLEALAYEQAAGIPANETVRRIRENEPVPGLRTALALASARLDAGDPWETCLRGTLLDTPTLADLASLAGHGAKPTQGYRWAAVRDRDLAVRGLRRAVVTIAVIILVPSFLYLAFLLHVASITAVAAQIDSVSQQIEQVTAAAEAIIQGEQKPDAEPSDEP